MSRKLNMIVEATDWLDALAETSQQQPVGRGWYTVAEIRKRTGWRESSARRRLAHEVEIGRMERFVGVANGRVTVWYRRK